MGIEFKVQSFCHGGFKVEMGDMEWSWVCGRENRAPRPEPHLYPSPVGRGLRRGSSIKGRGDGFVRMGASRGTWGERVTFGRAGGSESFWEDVKIRIVLVTACARTRRMGGGRQASLPQGAGFDYTSHGRLSASKHDRAAPRLHAAMTKGKLDWGPCKRVLCGEFDGTQAKRVSVKIIGE